LRDAPCKNDTHRAQPRDGGDGGVQPRRSGGESAPPATHPSRAITTLRWWRVPACTCLAATPTRTTTTPSSTTSVRVRTHARTHTPCTFREMGHYLMMWSNGFRYEGVDAARVHGRSAQPAIGPQRGDVQRIDVRVWRL
jgi:hypothetical protein